MRVRKWIVRAAAVAVAAGVCLYGPAGCGALVGVAVSRALPHAGVSGAVQVSHAGLFALRAGPLRLAGEGWSAVVESATVRYTPAGLARRRVERVEADGVRIEWFGVKKASEGAAEDWQDLNPALMLTRAAASAKGWRVGRFSVGDFALNGHGVKAWHASGTLNGSLDGRRGGLSATLAFDPLRAADAAGWRVTGRAEGELVAGEDGFSQARFSAEAAADHDAAAAAAPAPAQAAAAVELTFEGAGERWTVRGEVRGGTAGAGLAGQVKAAGADCGPVTVVVSARATGGTLRASAYAARVDACVTDLVAQEAAVRVPEVTLYAEVEAEAGMPPRLAGGASIPHVISQRSAFSVDAGLDATFAGVWPLDRLEGSVTAQVGRVFLQGVAVDDAAAAAFRWEVSGLTNGLRGAWQAEGTVCLSEAAARAWAHGLELAQGVAWDIRADGSIGGDVRAEARTGEAVGWRIGSDAGVASGRIGALSAGLTVSNRTAQVWAIAEEMAAAGGGATLSGGRLRLDGEVGRGADDGAPLPWRASAGVAAEKIVTTNGALAVSGLRAACTVLGAGAAAPGVASATLGWSELRTRGVTWEAEPVSLSITGGVLRAGLALQAAGSPLRAEIGAEAPLQAGAAARVTVRLPETVLAANDALYALASPAMALTVTGGTLAASAEAVIRPGRPVSVRGEARVRGLGLQDGKGLLAVQGVDSDAAFRGTGPDEWGVDGQVMFTRAAYGNLVATNGLALWRADPRELFVEKARAGWCGGQVQLFAVRADVRRQRADLTLFIDHVQLSEILGLVRAMPGTGQGVLYGRLPLRYEGGDVRFSDGFLYSLPGEGGRVQIRDTAMIESALKGIDPAVRRQVVTALNDLAFSVFRLDLEPPATPGGDAALKLRLSGQADKRADLPPVNLNVNLRGPLEALFNMGMRLRQ